MFKLKSKFLFLYLLLLYITVALLSAFHHESDSPYLLLYKKQLNGLDLNQQKLIGLIELGELNDSSTFSKVQSQLQKSRTSLKSIDFWIRYTAPIEHKKINGPLAVEWETEVFEKFEKPYRREGAGFTLAYLTLMEDNPDKTKISELINQSIVATHILKNDSILQQLNSFHHFYLCNRLYLLNLAAIYTTGFECPNEDMVIPELSQMLSDVGTIYSAFNQTFAATPLPDAYLILYQNAINFVHDQPQSINSFNHYAFIRDYINPLYKLNQDLIRKYKVVSKSMVDYTLNKQVNSIFDKSLYFGQNPKGIFLRVNDEVALSEIDNLGKSLFYDPILSGNIERSCASCHIPKMFFTDTTLTTSINFDRKSDLRRNTPTLLNTQYNHLLMYDGKHLTLQNQAKGVITSIDEMGGDEKELMKRINSCKEYKSRFTKLLKYTPQEKEITVSHIYSAITYYYSKFNGFDAPFDKSMNLQTEISSSAIKGFNLFMGKAQCATCHFVPQFNGVKPPYIGSEFEVIGVPADTSYQKLSGDSGRYNIFQASETLHAFRTGTIRNSMHTQPYMHNGVFNTMEQVIQHYNTGGAIGHGLLLPNQTLSGDPLNLSETEIQELITFIATLTEQIVFENPPENIPKSKQIVLNKRKIGGSY